MLVSLIAQKASSTSCKQRVERKNEKKNIKIIFFPEVETEMAKTAQRFHVFMSSLAHLKNKSNNESGRTLTVSRKFKLL